MEIGKFDLTGKKKVETHESRIIKRLMHELGNLYENIGIVPHDIQMIVNKLRDEFEKEKDKLVKGHAGELKPVSVEFDKLTEKIREYHGQIREMGKRHTTEQQQLAAKYIELELRVVRPAVK